MSNQVKIADALGKDEENNGLDDLKETFLADKEHVEIGLVWVRRRKVEEIDKTGERRVTVEILRFEPMGSPGAIEAEIVEAYLRKNKERRGGMEPLPIDSLPDDSKAIGS
jgi:hypothetical protein